MDSNNNNGAAAKSIATTTTNTSTTTAAAVMATNSNWVTNSATLAAANNTNLPSLIRVELLYTNTPVEGCNLIPYVVIKTDKGDIKSGEAIEAKTQGSLAIQYRWNRCVSRYRCANRNCGVGATIQFAPLVKLTNSNAIHYDPTLKIQAADPDDDDQDDIQQNHQQHQYHEDLLNQQHFQNLDTNQIHNSNNNNNNDNDSNIKAENNNNQKDILANNTAQTSTKRRNRTGTRFYLKEISNDQEESKGIQELRGERSLEDSFYCSEECMKECWTRLRILQNRYAGPYLERKREMWNTDFDRARIEVRSALGEDSLLLIDAVSKQGEDSDLAKKWPRVRITDPIDNPGEFHQIGWLKSYVPTAEDVGNRLELSCRYVFKNPADGEVVLGPISSLQTEPVIPIPPPPPERKLISLATGEYYSIRQHRNIPGLFRVLTYNCLAEIYANNSKHSATPDWALAWTYRSRNLIREIASYEADIICLQEVQADHYEECFAPWLRRLGFDGIFKPKTREAMGSKGKIDGCATFYRKDVFALRERHDVEYNACAVNRTKDTRQLNRLLKGNIGTITVLECLDGSRNKVCIANTHIYWDPELTDVKIFQVDVFLQEVEMIVARLGLDAPVIIAGDFNSEPDSAIYELITTGSVSLEREDINNDPYNILRGARLSHNLNLRSAYGMMGDEPPFTNYTTDYIGTLDYVFYAPDRLLAVGVLEVLDENATLRVDESTALPSTRWSSDHIGLMAEFQILQHNTMGI